jgi:hypothetical protein
VKRSALLASILVALAPTAAHAWEPETTHAGLAEQAALNSKLHKRLVNLGFSGGLFEPLTIPPADAPALIAAVKLLSPSHGSVPDARGRQSALSWLSAGAALADIPAAHGANHFYDPDTRRGWQKPSRGVIDGVTDRIREAIGRADLPERGVPAPDWVISPKNPFNVDAFYGQYAKAVSAKTPGERSRHMAAALVAAGSTLHALGDLGSPSRVRGDELAHLDPLGAGPDDLGSRFERIAALAHGRLGVPAPGKKIERKKLREFFTSTDGGGLADLTARSYFSPNTLPAESRIGGDNKPPLARAKPALPSRLNLMAASRDDGTTFRNSAGTCLSRYKVDHGVLTFWMDDECLLEQVTAILPEVAAYEAGLLDFLLRGELTIQIGPSVVVSGKELGAGTVEILVEDDRGVRTSLGTAPTQGAGAEPVALANVSTPSSGLRVLAVFRGVDRNGETMVATGAMPLSQ